MNESVLRAGPRQGGISREGNIFLILPGLVRRLDDAWEGVVGKVNNGITCMSYFRSATFFPGVCFCASFVSSCFWVSFLCFVSTLDLVMDVRMLKSAFSL